MKKRKGIKTLLVIATVILVIIAGTDTTDRILFLLGKNPIFVLPDYDSCEVMEYRGIGYKVIYPCPETTADDTREYSPDWEWFWE